MGHHSRPVIWPPYLPMHPLCLLGSLFVLSGTDRYVKECQDRAQALKGRELLLQQTLPTKEESKESQKSSQNEDGEETYISPTSLRVSGDCVLFANGHSKIIIDDETLKCYCGKRCEKIRQNVKELQWVPFWKELNSTNIKECAAWYNICELQSPMCLGSPAVTSGRVCLTCFLSRICCLSLVWYFRISFIRFHFCPGVGRGRTPGIQFRAATRW